MWYVHVYCLPINVFILWFGKVRVTAMFSEAQNIARSLLVELAYSLTCYLKKQVDFPDPLI